MRKNDAVLYEMKGHNDCPTGLSLSPDGNYIASNAMDNTVRIWDIRPFAAKERCCKVFQGHTHNFEKVCLVGALNYFLLIFLKELNFLRICSVSYGHPMDNLFQQVVLTNISIFGIMKIQK